MIPNNITKEHIEKAIQEIDKNGIEKGAHSSTYDVVYNNKRYPPKLVVSLANKYANGEILPRDSFFGGPSHKAFKLLNKLGFEIETKTETQSTDMANVKNEFANWLLKNAPDSYHYYLGSTIQSVNERLDEINGYFPDRDLYRVDENSFEELIAYIAKKNRKAERLKNKAFYTYDRKHSKGTPIAILGKENYFKFLKEKFELTAVNYWIFQGNPDIYNITNALNGGHLKSWKVAAHKDKINIGDKVIIWQTGSQAGCYALAEVISNVGVFKEEPYEVQHYIESHSSVETERVKLKIIKYLTERPILWSQIKDQPAFKYFKAGNQGTNFAATKEEYNAILVLQEKHKYSWVKTHKQLSQYLLDKEDQQLELIQLLKSSGVTGFKDQDENDNTIELDQIDPFTFYCYIYKYGPEKRLQTLQKIAETLNLSIPRDELGIPSTQAIQVHVFPWKKDRTNEINRLWNFFYSTLNKRITDIEFLDILKISGVGHTKLTEMLFYVDSEFYFPINGPTKPYLEEVLHINPNFNTYSEYESILNQIRDKTDVPFYQLSHEAWLWNEANKNGDSSNFMKYLNRFSKDDLNIYFSFLFNTLDKFNLSEGDERLFYSTTNNNLAFTIGQRFSWCLFKSNKKGKFGVLSKDKIIPKSEEFSGNAPYPYYTYLDEINFSKIDEESIFSGFEQELKRTNKTGYKKHNNEDFEHAVFDKSFRAKFINTETMNEKNISSNNILYGPPGTGKTYNSINEALKIVDPEYYTQHKEDRYALNQRFKELLIKNWNKTNGQIAFCTFHQSFSYEDFVEGIKPKTNDKKEVFYEIEEGVFKKICQLADSSISAVKMKKEGKLSWDDERFNRASFYKLSLGNSQKSEDKIIYDYCIDNNVIALGYGDNNDFTNLSEGQITEKCEDLNFDSNVAQSLNYFIHYIKKDNYVIIGNGNKYVRALAKVIGDYEFDPATPISYNHFRKVEWIFKDENIPIEELYNRGLSQQTIYKIDEGGLKKEFFVNHGQSTEPEVKKIKDYVLIIDEINRGNVSSIFAELITLIEKDKRAGGEEELEVTLPYSKDPFRCLTTSILSAL